MRSNWYIKTIKGDFNGIAEHFGVSPITARLLVNRGLSSFSDIEEYINCDKEELTDPSSLIGLPEAVEIIRNKIDEKKKIRVIGDYDVDGVCSTFILVDALRAAGADIDYDIPDRAVDGYGLNMRLVTKALSEGIDTIITCDNGIAAYDEIAHAKANGMTVILTDHHDIPVSGKIPPADTVTDAKIPESEYPYRNICGAVVAFNLIRLYYNTYNTDTDVQTKYLPFAALATICDVMELEGENRRIVKRGLPLIKATDNVGLRSLLSATGLYAKNGDASVYDCGFILGPCINACGRLKHANIAMSLFLESDPEIAKLIAETAKGLNEERKKDTEEGLEKAVAAVEEKYTDDKVLIVYVPDCGASIAGIVAGKLKERYGRPTVVLTDSDKGIKGSGRSIDEYNMFQEFSKHLDFFAKFGGHPLAAGLSMAGGTKEEQLANAEKLRIALNEETTLSADDLIPKVHFDMELPLKYVSEGLINEWKRLEPFGEGNEKPLFAKRGVTLRSLKVLGKNRNAVKMTLSDGTRDMYDGIHFGPADDFLADLAIKFGEGPVKYLLEREGQAVDLVTPLVMDIIYYPSINEFNGRRTVQFIIEYIK